MQNELQNLLGALEYTNIKNQLNDVVIEFNGECVIQTYRRRRLKLEPLHVSLAAIQRGAAGSMGR